MHFWQKIKSEIKIGLLKSIESSDHVGIYFKEQSDIEPVLKRISFAFGNKAQFCHFQHYIIALMVYLEDKNLSGLSRLIPDGRHESSLYRFLSDLDFAQIKCGIGLSL